MVQEAPEFVMRHSLLLIRLVWLPALQARPFKSTRDAKRKVAVEAIQFLKNYLRSYFATDRSA